MQSITRSNAKICCRVCLVLLTASVPEQEPLSDLHDDAKLRKCLGSFTTPLSDNEIDFPHRLCFACSSKIQALHHFGETSLCNLIALRELVIDGELDAKAVQNLQHFCRICLEKFKTETDLRETCNDEVCDWMQQCTDIVLSDDLLEFPKRVCSWCVKQLRDFVEYRRMAQQSYACLQRVLTEQPADREPIGKEPVLVEELVDEELDNELPVDEEPVVEEPVELEHVDKEPGNAEPVDPCNEVAEHYKEDMGHYGAIETVTDSIENTEMPEAVDDDDAANDPERSLPPTACSSPNVSESIAVSVDKLEAENCDSSAAPIVDDNEPIVESEKTPLIADPSESSLQLQPGSDEKTIAQFPAREEKENDDDNARAHAENDSDKEQMSNGRHDDAKATAEKPTRKSPSESKRLIKCPECFKKFRKQLLFEAHMRREHEGIATPFQCHLCPKSFRLHHYLGRHITEAHVLSQTAASSTQIPADEPIADAPASGTLFSCNICERSFKRNEHLKQHILTVHEGKRPYKCQYCNKSFGARRTLRVHEMGHRGEKPFECKQCGKSFRQVNELRVHEEQHKETAEHLCPVCKRAKPSIEELQKHIVASHATVHHCPKCGKIFKKRSSLREHDESVHQRLERYVCRYCGKKFIFRRTFSNHLETHTKPRESPVPCEICNKTLKSAKSLTRHLQLHLSRAATEAPQST